MNVQFNDGGVSYNRPTQKGGMAGWLVTKGLAKNESQAQFFLLIFAILGLIAAWLIYTVFMPEDERTAVTPAEVEEYIANQPLP